MRGGGFFLESISLCFVSLSPPSTNLIRGTIVLAVYNVFDKKDGNCHITKSGNFPPLLYIFYGKFEINYYILADVHPTIHNWHVHIS